MKISLLILLFFSLQASLRAQQSVIVKGRIIDDLNNNPVQSAQIFIDETVYLSYSDVNGNFLFSLSVSKETPVTFTHPDYESRTISLDGHTTQDSLLLGNIRLRPSLNKDLSNTISSDELATFVEENDESNYVTGLLSSGKDLFNRTSSFEFSAAFFRPRNVNANYNRISLNGILINTFLNVRGN